MAPGQPLRGRARDAVGGVVGNVGSVLAALGRPVRRLGAVVHVGYPPVMAGIDGDGGRALAAALAWARERGASVSLDMAMPDPAGPAAHLDWAAFLARVLPVVDLYAPSWSDLTVLLPGLPAEPDRDALARISASFLDGGTAAVLLKLGRRGAYLRTSPGHAGGGGWHSRELLSPSFVVAIAGTTGAGDATIAGFLAAVLSGAGPEHALSIASATGACSVAGVDAVAGVPTLAGLEARLADGWARSSAAWFGSAGVGAGGILRGPDDTFGEVA